MRKGVGVFAAVVAAGAMVFGVMTAALATSTPDGELDTAFATTIGSGFNYEINTVAVQADNKILVGGWFTEFQGNPINYIARFNADGTLDTDFMTALGDGFDGAINSIAVQSDGKIVVGGYFYSFDGTDMQKIARLNADGSLDQDFTDAMGDGFSHTVLTVAMQGSKILVGGFFNNFDGTSTKAIARLNADGTLDTAFTDAMGSGLAQYSYFQTRVYSIVFDADGKILVGGLFAGFDGTDADSLIRLNADGSHDMSFNINGAFGNAQEILTVAVQPDGKIFAGGSLTSFDGTPVGGIVRFSANGTFDTTFNTKIGTGFNSLVYSIVVQSDGKVLIGGLFDTFNGNPAGRLVRFEANDDVDTDFSTALGGGFDNAVYSIKFQSDGKIIVGGLFKNFGDWVNNNGTEVGGLARLAGSAAPDPTPSSSPSPSSGPNDEDDDDETGSGGSHNGGSSTGSNWQSDGGAGFPDVGDEVDLADESDSPDSGTNTNTDLSPGVTDSGFDRFGWLILGGGMLLLGSTWFFIAWRRRREEEEEVERGHRD